MYIVQRYLSLLIFFLDVICQVMCFDSQTNKHVKHSKSDKHIKSKVQPKPWKAQIIFDSRQWEGQH